MQESLGSLPVDVLRPICGLISAEDIAHLWWTGDSRPHGRRRRRCFVRARLCGRVSWPRPPFTPYIIQDIVRYHAFLHVCLYKRP